MKTNYKKGVFDLFDERYTKSEITNAEYVSDVKVLAESV